MDLIGSHGQEGCFLLFKRDIGVNHKDAVFRLLLKSAIRSFSNFKPGRSYIYTYIHTYKDAYTPTFTYVNLRLEKKNQINIFAVHTYIYTYTLTYIHTYIHTYINTHKPFVELRDVRHARHEDENSASCQLPAHGSNDRLRQD